MHGEYNLFCGLRLDGENRLDCRRWRRVAVAPHWTFKAEYLYVDLGRDRVRSIATALGTVFVGTSLSSYIADFGRTDFHVVRAGVNYQF